LAEGLEKIQSKGLPHLNFHGGNILFEYEDEDEDEVIAKIDANFHGKIYPSNNITGVLPFMDPQVLLGNKPLAKASNSYSLGIVMWALATSSRPHYNRAHDSQLAYEICCKNLRPEVNEELKLEMPKKYYDLMTWCWSSQQESRPTASQLREILEEW
ncbi:17967_t:CDS:1, partial [Racocetra persica]